MADAKKRIKQLEKELESMREYCATKDGWADPNFYSYETILGKTLAELAEVKSSNKNLKTVLGKTLIELADVRIENHRLKEEK